MRGVGLKISDDASSSPSFSPFKGSGVFAIQEEDDEDEDEDVSASKDGRDRDDRRGSRSFKSRKSGELDVVPITLFDRFGGVSCHRAPTFAVAAHVFI